MTEKFEILNSETAPEASRPALAQSQSSFGQVPNLQGVMALSPQLLKTHLDCLEQFKSTTLTPAEQQVVYLTVNFEHNCEYCVPWHTRLAQMAKLPEAEIENLRNGAPLEDQKLNALHQFTKALVRTRGSIAPADLEQFLNAGFSKTSALDVVLGIANKVVSNFTAAITQVPLDEAVQSLSWEKPNLRG